MPKKSAKKAIRKAVTKKTARKTATNPVAKRAMRKAMKTAGRPKGTGKYGCPTTAMRIPAHLKDEVQAFVVKRIKAEAKKQ